MKKYLFILIFSLLIVIPIMSVLAADDATSPCTGGTCTLGNPLGIDSPQELIGRIITSVMGVVGSLALLMFIYGGLTWMTSSGSAEKVKKGRDIILWSAVGLVVIFMSYALVRFVLSTMIVK
ncbi:MAG: pilin [Patescibacteria group bacterium]|jgi:hypothetical protein